MSTMNAIINVSNIDFKQISFGDLRVNKNNGSKSVPIRYNGQNLQLRIPKMRYAMGVNIKETENGTNYSMMASLDGCDKFAKERAPPEAGEVGQLYNFLKDLEDKLLQTSVEKSTQWFGRARKEDVLRDSMKQFISPSVDKVDGAWVPNGKWPPSFRMKVPVWDGKVSMEAVDSTGRTIALTTDNLEQIFPKRMEARFVVSPSVYVSGQGFGVTWRISFAQVMPTQRLSAAAAFADVQDEPHEDEEPQEQVQSVEVPTDSRPETPPSQVAQAPAPASQPPKTVNRRRVPAAAAL
jgi:hypothetical protein